MNVVVANHSSYPRIDEGKEGQRLRRACEAWQRGDKRADQFKAVQDLFVEQVMAEQLENGCDLITDGMIRWYDPVSHLCSKIDGIKIGGLLRYFDTNFYFRQPLVTGRVKRKEPLILEDIKFALKATKRPLKAVLTGPVTLAHLSLLEPGSYGNQKELTKALADILEQEIKELSQLKLAQIQIDEPMLTAMSERVAEFLPLLEPLASCQKEVPVSLTTYFGDATKIYSPLQETAFDTLGFDMSYSPGLWEKMGAFGIHKNLALGVVDGRNTRLESSDKIISQVKGLAENLEQHKLTLMPSCGLEFLPRAKAQAKLSLLAAVKQRLN